MSRCVAAAATDEELAIPLAGAAHLYSLGFLVIGLGFFLSHFAGTLNWLFYFATTKSAQEAFTNQGDDRIYRLTSELLPCVTGALCLFLAPKWGKRMAVAFDRTPEPPEKA